MTVRLLPPSCSLIDEILHLLDGTGKDFSGGLVVFPSIRPSHFLRKAIGHQVQGRFIPPAVMSMEELADFIYEEKLHRYDRKLDTIDAVAILYQIHRTSTHPIGGDGFLTADAFFPLGLDIYRDLEELTLEGVRLEAVKDMDTFSKEKIPAQSLKNLQSLSWFYQEFYRVAYVQGYSTRASRYRDVSDNLKEEHFDSFTQIILAGFYGLTKREMDIFTTINRMPGTHFLFHEGQGIHEMLTRMGMGEPATQQESSPICCKDGQKEESRKQADIRFYKSPDTHGQVFGFGEILRQLLDSGQGVDETTVLVLPSSDTLFPLYHQSLSLLKDNEYNISLGYPLHRTPIYGFFANLMDLVCSRDEDRFYVPDYLKLVLHPYIKNVFFDKRTDLTRIMFHTIEEELVGNRVRTFLSLKELEDNRDILDAIGKRLAETSPELSLERVRDHLKGIHHAVISPYLSFTNTGDFAGKSMQVLTYIYENTTAPLHPFFYPFSEAFFQAFHLLSRSLMKDVAFIRPEGYFSLFKKYIMTRRSPFEGTPLRGLQVLGFLETRGIRFKKVFILDVNEEVLPGTRKEDTLLPFQARTLLGLPTHLDRERYIAYYFDILTAAADEVHLFFIENQRKEKSRYVEQLLWQYQQRDKTVNTDRYVRSLQYFVELKATAPEPIAKTPQVVDILTSGMVYSATSLDTYLDCPLRFYYQYVLKIGKREKITGDLDSMDIGSFVHAGLAEFFRPCRGRPLTPEDLSPSRMEEVLKGRFASFYGTERSGSAYLLKRQVTQRLIELLDKYYGPLVENHEVEILSVEEEVAGTIGPFTLKGRLDCVQKRDGRTYIIDYKTSARDEYLKINFKRLDPFDRSTWDDAIGTVQMPLYVMLYGMKWGIVKEELRGVFLLLGRSVVDEKVECPLFDDTKDASMDASSAYEAVSLIIRGLLEEIANPDVAFPPPAELGQKCAECDFHSLCTSG